MPTRRLSCGLFEIEPEHAVASFEVTYMITYKIRLMRTVSFETDIEVEAINEQSAKTEALQRAPFLIWEHRNKAEYEVLTIKVKKDDAEETKQMQSPDVPRIFPKM